MILLWITLFAFMLSLGPAILFFKNLGLFGKAPAVVEHSPLAVESGIYNGRLFTPTPGKFISVLVPARNEESQIADCLNHVLSNVHAQFEVIVLDDHSSDQTGEIVRAIASQDARVRLETAPTLPAGWCGKQHACHCLSKHAKYDLYLFLDADVRLSRDALSRAAAFLESSGAALVSGFPLQETGSFLETLLLPLIHFVLLGFLPLEKMRSTRLPALGAGCGQLFLAEKNAYRAAGGHAAIRGSLHDGIMLPRAFRRSGFATDLFDATGLASCRMYQGAKQTWEGLAKNATEAMASPLAILPWTILLSVGQILPWFLLVVAFFALGRGSSHAAASLAFAAASSALGVAMRLVAAKRFNQSTWSAWLHPAGITTLLAVQWYALFRQFLGKPAAWRGRNYTSMGSSDLSTAGDKPLLDLKPYSGAER